MKYIGENAIKKLISLIKSDIKKKLDKNQGTANSGKILGVNATGEVAPTDTEVATLVDVPNGIVKGNGSTLSAAVAETDYMAPPTGGTTGQVLKKTETGTEWADAPQTVTIPETTALLKGNGSGGLAAATAGTDYALRPTTRKVTLTASGWNSSTKQQTVTCSGVLSDTTKQLLIPTPVNTAAGNPYDEASIQMVAQGANSVTFYAETVPTVGIDVYVTIYPINYLG